MLLSEIQRAFGAAMFGDDDTIAPHVVEAGIPARARVRIYRNTAISVLVNALRLSYPAVDRLVGADFFDGAAVIFIRDHPPASSCMTEYGAGFAGFLVSFHPAQSLAYLPDVARFEWALNVAASAPDTEALEAASLTNLDPRDHGRVRFEPHPSLTLLRLDHPADAITDAVIAGDKVAMAEVDVTAGPVWLVIHRGPHGVEARGLTERDWRLTQSLCQGVSLEAALDASEVSDPISLVADHLVRGRFAGFEVIPPTTESPP